MSTPWPPPAGLTTPTVSRESTVLSIAAHTTISAPAPLIFSVLCSTADYPAWNTFCPRITIHQQPSPVSEDDINLHLGTSFTFHVVMDANKPAKVTDTQCRITDISTPEATSRYLSQEMLREGQGTFEMDLGRVWRISWTTEGSFVARGLRTERFTEIVELGEGKGCEVRTWECQGGILARMVKYYYKSVLERKFEDWCADLKREAERREREARV